MAGRSVNVDLRIKAQDEASKALETVSKALKDLGTAQGALSTSSGVSKFVDDLTKNVDNLGGLFRKLDNAVKSSNGTYEQQVRQLSAVNASIDERKRRIAELTKAVADLDRVEGTYKNRTSKTFVGPVPSRVAGDLRKELTTNTTNLGREEASVTKFIDKIAQARDAELQLKGVQTQVASAIASTTATILKQADALDKLSDAEAREALAAQQALSAKVAAERRNTALQDRINSTTGVGRTSALSGGAGFGALEERNRQLEDAIAELQQRRSASFLTPTTSGKSASASASVFTEDFSKQEQNIKDAEAAFAAFEARAKQGAAAMQQVQQYARDVAEALDPVAKVTRLVAEEEARLGEAVKLGALSRGQADAQLQRYKAGLDGTSAATAKEAREIDSLNTYVQELRREFDRAGYAERFLAQETEKLNTAVKKGVLSQQEYGKALETVKRKAEQLGEKSNPTAFGLNPYQFQNLTYQINDVFTQIASGTSITQTLAQQGGQILQLFPKAGNSMVTAFRGAGLAGTALVAILAAIGIGINEAFGRAERLRNFEGILAAVATTSASSATEINEAAKAIDRYGLSAEESIAITKRLLREGFDAAQIKDFALTAKDMADVLGIDVNRAVELLTDAYSGNLTSLRRLMDETNTFTPAQRKAIEAMYASGDAAGAVDKAFKILSGNMEEGARKARGPWTTAFRTLGNAWDGLVEQLGNTVWAKGAVEAVNGLAAALDWLSGKSEQARAAEERRMGAYSQYDPATDPLYGSAAGQPGDPSYDARQRAAGGKTDREDVGTLDQQNTATVLTKEAQRQAILAKEVTSQKIIQEKIDVRRAQLEEEIGNTVIEADRNKIIAIRLEKERLDLAKQLEAYNKRQADAAKSAANDEERSLKAYVAKVVKTESGGNTNAKNPNSSATGVGQFIESTWLDMFRRYYPAEAANMGRDAILALRNDATVSKSLIEAYARENAAVLRKAGASVTEANLYLAHFLGPDGAAKVIRAAASTPISQILTGKGGRAAIAANPTILGGNATAGSVRAFTERRFPGANASSEVQAQLEGEAAIKDAQDERLATQQQFNTELEQENNQRDRSYNSAKSLIGLQGQALLQKQKEQAIAEAIADKEAELVKLNEARLKSGKAPIQTTLTDAQKQDIARTTGAEFDLRTTEVVQNQLQTKVNELLALRDSIQAQIQSELERGNTGTAKNLEAQLGGINDRLRTSAQELLDYQIANAQALGLSAEAIDTLKLKQDALNESTRQWVSILGIGGQQIAQTFTNAAVNAIDQFTQAVAKGENVFKSMWAAFRQFASDFLLQMAKMIQQQIIFNLVKGVLSAVGGAFGGVSSGTVQILSGSAMDTISQNAAIFHAGGVVGGPSPFRSVSPAMFANANRYHSGGIAGLKPGEVPSVLMRGEEVLTRDDPRHIMNGGGGGGGGNVKIVNTFDESDFFSKGANTKAGEKAILNLVRSNPRAFKAAMGGA